MPNAIFDTATILVGFELKSTLTRLIFSSFKPNQLAIFFMNFGTPKQIAARIANDISCYNNRKCNERIHKTIIA